MPILKHKNKETGEWEQVGVSTEATGAQIGAHNVDPESHADIRQAISQLAAVSVSLNDASKVYTTKVVLPVSDWEADALTQSVAVPGILADDTKQLIQAVPAPASIAVAAEADVYCSGQGDGFLTFACESIPVADITVNISYQTATFVG